MIENLRVVARRESLSESRLEHDRDLRGIRLKERVEIRSRGNDGDRAEHVRSRSRRARIANVVASGDGSTIARRTSLHVRSNREPEQHDLHNRHEDQHGERAPVAQNVIRLLPEQSPERVQLRPAARSAGRASRTNTSSIESTPNCCLSSAGVPIASMRPATMIEIRSQYSASSM